MSCLKEVVKVHTFNLMLFVILFQKNTEQKSYLGIAIYMD